MQWRDIRTGLTVVTQPAIEPVSRAEAKWHAQIDQVDENHLIDLYIAAARRQLEQDTSRTPVNTVYDFTIDRFPEERSIAFPRIPVGAVASVTSYDEDDAAAVLSSGDYRLDTALHRLVLNDDATWPSTLRRHSAGVIRFTAGGNGTPVSVTSVTSTGTAPSVTATVTTSSAHGFTTGDRVTMAGAAQDAYDGTFTIVVTGATTFTYAVVNGTPAATATGTITARLLQMPESHRLAVLELVAHFVEHRSAVASEKLIDLPRGYAALIGTDRVYAMA